MDNRKDGYFNNMKERKMTEKRIVVLQRGWVVVGNYEQEGEAVTIENASVVRRWGTQKGLGELATKGPLKDTILDPCGTVRAHINGIVLTIDTKGELWS